MRGAALLVLLAGGAATAWGCGKAADPVPGRPTATQEAAALRQVGSRTVADMTGRSIQVHETTRTVAALSPAAADFAAALGLEVVGRTTDTPASAAPDARVTGSTINPDFQAVAALAPDLVIADAAYHAGRTRDFDRFAYPVFVVKANSYAEVLAALTALGEATGRTEQAKTAAAAIEERADAATATAGESRSTRGTPKVLILSGGGRDVFAGGSSSYVGNLAAQLGATNVLAQAAEGGPVPGFGVVEITQAASYAPDVVLILPSGQGGLAAQIKADPAWTATPAVRNGRVHDIDTLLYLRAPGPRVGEALEGLVRLLWP